MSASREPASLLDLPGELTCKVFEELPSLTDMIALRTARISFLHLYLTYEKQLRSKQREKIIRTVRGYYTWLTRPSPEATASLEPNNVIRHRPIPSTAIMLPDEEWDIAEDKQATTLYILRRLPFIDLGFGSHSLLFWQGKTCVNWLGMQHPQTRHFSPTYLSLARRHERMAAAECGLVPCDTISLTHDAELLLHTPSARIFWTDHRQIRFVSEMEHFFCVAMSPGEALIGERVDVKSLGNRQLPGKRKVYHVRVL